MRLKPAASEPCWDGGSFCDVAQYHAARRDAPAAQRCAREIEAALGPHDGGAGWALNVAEAGCGAGAQARLWAAQGHQVFGIDADAALIALARRDAAGVGLEILFDVAAASALPWPDRSMDVCIAPRRLADAADWRACCAEFLRVLRPGGALFIGATDSRCATLLGFKPAR